jgi:NAD(P)-dependent dehydrogenase (short-subunit alcohol dehydrogenase family)
MIKFDNKIIYIIGGQGLVGKKIIKLFKKLNYKKIIVLDKIASRSNKKIRYEKLDISNNLEMEKKFDYLIKSKKECPDIVINCSYPKTKNWVNNNFQKVDYNNYKENIDAHLNSYVWSTKILIEKMKMFKKPGNILLFSSIYGVVAQNNILYQGTGVNQNFTYPIIKHGIVGATKQFAVYYGKYNIRVNCICPGGIISKELKKNEKFNKIYRQICPMGRLADPDEIAKASLLFVSDYASYINGAILMVDGGWSSI